MINIELENVHAWDYPDFCDAFVAYCEHDDGTPYTEQELDDLNEQHPEIAQELAFEWLI